MIRRLLLAILATVALHSTVSAQTARASVGDSTVVRDNVFRELFEGIALAPALHPIALEIIARYGAAKRALFPIRSQERYEELVATYDREEAELSVLLTSPADRKLFAQHAIAFRPRSTLWKTPPRPTRSEP
jgi:hypothetical protein